jgi:acyl-coenzyme A synthetase/AMP-(fatty) acid ligase
LDFVGRKDDMVKIRGQRVELAEVEHHVRAHLQRTDLCDGIAAEIITPRDGKRAILTVFVSLGQDKEALGSEEKMIANLSLVIEGLDEALSSSLPQ